MKLNNNNYISLVTYLTCFFYAGSIHAEAAEKNALHSSQTEWTLGVGLGVLDYRLYPGAKQSNQLIIPLPYFTYSSPVFEIDRGIKSFIYNSEEVIIDISADFGLPVDSDDTLARTGMQDLDLVLQLGPSLEFLLNDKHANYFDMRFELATRAAFTVDLKDVSSVGYLIEPRFSFDHRRNSKTGLSHKGTIGIKFASQKFNAYYYDVATEFATATRAAYKSEAGFGGGFVKYRIAYKTDDFVYWAFARYQSLRGAVFEDSPLVLKQDYYFLGIGISWIFAQSQ